jgi:hypothetical protein
MQQFLAQDLVIGHASPLSFFPIATSQKWYWSICHCVHREGRVLEWLVRWLSDDPKGE